MANAIAMIAACMIHQKPIDLAELHAGSGARGAEAPSSGQHVTRDSEDVVEGTQPLEDAGAFWTA